MIDWTACVWERKRGVVEVYCYSKICRNKLMNQHVIKFTWNTGSYGTQSWIFAPKGLLHRRGQKIGCASVRHVRPVQKWPILGPRKSRFCNYMPILVSQKVVIFHFPQKMSAFRVRIKCPHPMSAKYVRIRRPHDPAGRSYARAPSGPLAPAGVI